MPHGYIGDIVKQLKVFEKYSVCNLKAIETEMPRLSDETEDLLSCDQKFLSVSG